MKKLLLFATLILAVAVNAQRIEKTETYTASNGITYKVGDTITLGKGSGMNGHFAYVQMGGFYNAMAAMNGNTRDISSGLDRNYSGTNVVLKKIKTYKDRRGTNKTTFVVGGGNITNYDLRIEDAISSCEIKDCTDTQKVEVVSAESKYDKLKKIKELKDSGVLNDEEFEAEKKKIMQL